MPERSLPRGQRLSNVEDQVADLTRNARTMDAFERPGSTRWPKLAITTYDPNTSQYPTEESNPNTYWIKFVDGDYDDSDDGNQTRTLSNRQTDARRVCQNIAQTYIPQGTLIWVFRQDQKFWTCFQEGGGETLQKIPFRNDSGETAPAFGLMRVVAAATIDGPTATVNTGTDVWTLAAAQTWSTGDRVRFNTSGTAPTTSPADGLRNGRIVWVRMLSTTTCTLHPSEADAAANANTIDCTTAGTVTHRLQLADLATFLTIDKPSPNETHIDLYVVNDAADVPDGEMGRCTWLSCSYDYPVRVLYDPSDFDDVSPKHPTVQDTLGPTHDSWKAKLGRFGLVVVGDHVDDGDKSTVNVFAHREESMMADASYFKVSKSMAVSSFDPASLGWMYIASGLWPRSTGVGVANPKDAPDGGVSDSWRFPAAIIHPEGIVNGHAGKASFATERPQWAQYESAQSIAGGFCTMGLIPGSAKLHRGLPGFRPIHFDTTKELVLVVADWLTSAWWGIAAADWQEDGGGSDPYVWCYVYDRNANKTYNGVAAGYPEVKIRVLLPRCGQGRDPIVFAGDHVPWRIAAHRDVVVYNGNDVEWGPGNTPLMHAGEYLDLKIGTILPYRGSPSTIPPGWRLADGGSGTLDLRGRFLVGYEDRTGGSIPAHSHADYNTVGNAGGGITHGHTANTANERQAGGSSRVTGVQSADHRPSFTTVCLIERYK